ncbi:MAG: SpoIIE family protein phosphatase [Desulfobacula sp.]|nr:SpoIIE family protein phosphatase [Desulfobacula sp.]
MEQPYKVKKIKGNIKNRLEDESLRQDIQRYKQLLNIGQIITSEIHFKSLFSVIMNQTKKIMGAERSTVFLFDDKAHELWSLVATDMENNKITIPCNQGIAGWVFNKKESLCINDTYNDTRFNFKVDSESGFRTKNILCTPIINRRGECIGVLQTLNSIAGKFTTKDINFLKSIASYVAIALENARLYEDMKRYSEHLKALNDEMQRGKKIQKYFLPSSLPEIKNCDISSYFNSALQLSGDFYDMFELSDNHHAFVIGDVSGKGVGSALFMALVRSLLRIFSRSFDIENDENNPIDPGKNWLPKQALKTVSLINEYIAKEHCEEGMFVTLFFAIIDTETGKVFYINCGHEPGLVIGKNGIKNSLNATGPPLGPVQDAGYEIESIQFEPGDILFGFTDGITEARSETRDFYTRKRLEDLINYGFDGPSQSFLDNIKTNLFEFIGFAPPSDDITMLAVKWK